MAVCFILLLLDKLSDLVDFQLMGWGRKKGKGKREKKNQQPV
jgi:hypothetical protein